MPPPKPPPPPPRVPARCPLPRRPPLPSPPAGLWLAVLALAALAVPGSPQADAASGGSWPRCDECEAVVTQMGPPPHIPTPHASPNRVLTASAAAGRASV